MVTRADNVVLNFTFPMPDKAGRLNVHLTPAALLGGNKQVLRHGLDGARATEDQGRSERRGRD